MKHTALLISTLAVLSFCSSCDLGTEKDDKDHPLPDEVPMPEAVSATEDYYVTFTSATLTGTFKGEIGKNVVFGFNYGTSKDLMTSFAEATREGEKAFKAEINGLQSGKRYYFQPVAKNKYEELTGKEAERITFTEGPVDLGLPSGIKWAACNLGAELPTDAGGYYSWGETEEKNYYDWTQYKWCDGDQFHFTKYNRLSGHGTVDNKTQLDASDDVAQVKLGGSWRMPTSGEVQELVQNCYVESMTINGIRGAKVISKLTTNEEIYLFIPDAGYKKDGGCTSGIYLWSSTVFSSPYAAHNLHISGTFMQLSNGNRYFGEGIRPVCK